MGRRSPRAVVPALLAAVALMGAGGAGAAARGAAAAHRSTAVAPGSATLAPGSAALAPGSAALAPGSAALAPGSATLAPGSAALAPVSAALAPGSTVPCGPPAARTLASDPRARIYVLHATAYGCAASGPGAVALGSTDGLCPRTPQAGPVALGATIAAYALRTCGIDLATAQIVVRSLATGRRIATLDALTVEVGAEAFESVGSVAVRADGDCAWIARSDSIAGHHRITEVVSRARGATHELGAGAAIAIGSLRLSGSRLTWRDGRRVRAAVLS